MRNYLLVTAIVAILTVYESGCASTETEELIYGRTKLFEWDYNDLGTSSFEDAHYSPRKPFGHVDTQTCPDEWVQMGESCYFIERDASGFVRAEKGSYDKNSTLFITNPIDERELALEAVKTLAQLLDQFVEHCCPSEPASCLRNFVVCLLTAVCTSDEFNM